jgi:hypothetical protein
VVTASFWSYKRLSNCLLLGNALQSQLLRVALKHQISPKVTSFVSYGTLFGTLIKLRKKHTRDLRVARGNFEGNGVHGDCLVTGPR